MNTEAIREKMLACHKNCSVGIMKQAGKMHLVWNAGNEMHKESLSTEQCTITSDEFKGALERAKISLIH